MSESLPELIRKSEELSILLMENEGEMTPELEQLLAMSGQSLKEKLDSYGFVIDSLKSRNEYAIARMKQWEAIASKSERLIDDLSSRIKNALERLESLEMHGYEYTFRVQANPPKVILDNEGVIPAEFVTTEVVTTTKISKKAILDAFKAGREVLGAHVERSTKLVIKPSQRKEIKPKGAVERI